MPNKPSRPCPGQGPYIKKCRNLIKGSDRYCHVCIEYFNKEVKKNNKQYDIERNQSAERKLIHSVQWRRIRLRKLAKDPLCEKCLSLGKEVKAVLVHHIDFNELNNNDSNHLSLCNDCHENIHKTGRWRKR